LDFRTVSRVTLGSRCSESSGTPEDVVAQIEQVNSRNPLEGLIRLSRYKDYAASVAFTTGLGAGAGGATFSWQLVLVLIANLLAVAYAFMINDVEDAPDDALNPEKITRNPVCAGLISRPQAYLASYLVAAAAVLAYLPLGVRPAVIGLTCVIFGHLYSWRPVRLKAKPVLDVVSHCLMLAGLQFLCAYFSFADSLQAGWFAPFLAIVAASSYGQLYNEVRDFEGDLEAGLGHTAIRLGKPLATLVMNGFLATSILAGAWTLAIDRLIPLWVIAFALAALLALFVPSYLRARGRHETAIGIQEPIVNLLPVVGTLMIAAWFVGPWMVGQVR
jgi:4-hydroxybenzoate polyprenyltransferase